MNDIPQLNQKEEFMKKLKAIIPLHYDALTTKHTLVLKTLLMSRYWDYFKSELGMNILEKDFTQLTIKINGREVILDKAVKNYFPFPNKMYLGYGHSHNKGSILIDLTDAVWEEAVKNGYLEIFLEFELLPKQERIKQISFRQEHKKEEIAVAYSAINMKVNINNANEGEHLVIDCPTCFFRMEDFKEFQEKKLMKEADVKGAEFIVRSTDLENYMYYTLSQRLEISTEAYSIYYKFSDLHHASFLFGDVCRSIDHDRPKHQDFYKIVGVVSENKTQEGEDTCKS